MDHKNGQAESEVISNLKWLGYCNDNQLDETHGLEEFKQALFDQDKDKSIDGEGEQDLRGELQRIVDECREKLRVLGFPRKNSKNDQILPYDEENREAVQQFLKKDFPKRKSDDALKANEKSGICDENVRELLEKKLPCNSSPKTVLNLRWLGYWGDDNTDEEQGLREFNQALFGPEEDEKIEGQKAQALREELQRIVDECREKLLVLGFLKADKMNEGLVGYYNDNMEAVRECLKNKLPEGESGNKLEANKESGICDHKVREFLRQTPPIIFYDVLRGELESIQCARAAVRQNSGIDSCEEVSHPVSLAHEARLMGLAFSGGGIRSATFNLGVLQALSRFQLLHRFDYLSTVSGGGYIGGWLHAWVHRSNKNLPEHRKGLGILEVEGELARSVGFDPDASAGTDQRHCRTSVSSLDHEPSELSWLRKYSNYLTPNNQLLGSDVMAGVATWLRNVILNQATIVFLLVSFLAVAWLSLTGFEALGCSVGEDGWSVEVVVSGVFGLALWMVGGSMASNSFPISVASKGRPKNDCLNLGLFLLAFASPFIGATFAAIAPDGDFWHDGWAAWRPYTLFGAVFGAAFFVVAMWFVRNREKGGLENLKSGWLWASLVSAIAFVVFLALFGEAVWRPGVAEHKNWILITVLSGPAVLVSALLGWALLVAMLRRSLAELSREWLSRFSGMLLRLTLFWVVFSGVAIFGPFMVEQFRGFIEAMGAVWVVTTVGGLIAAGSRATGSEENPWRERLAKTAPYVFVVGLIVLVAWLFWFVLVSIDYPSGVKFGSDGLSSQSEYEIEINHTGLVDPENQWLRGKIDKPARISYEAELYYIESSALRNAPLQVVLLVVPFLLALALGKIVDINLFSFHQFYSNRLARCYLGASNRERKKCRDTFTDFCKQDSPVLADLKSDVWCEGDKKSFIQRPFPLINATLNITKVENTAWQERKAASFTFSPANCGYQLRGNSGLVRGGFQKTDQFRASAHVPDREMRLETPIAVSGAAASPNSGYHTSPATSALMAAFNVRLGMWIQNPGLKLDNLKAGGVWQQGGPSFSLKYFLKELMSSTDDQDKFVYVSDGGHFENLGLYELVRRRCRYIVLCDAECDPSFKFEGLGNAIRKCKVDFGIDIEIDTTAITPDPETGLSKASCAVGRIHYERRDGARAVATGYLLYVKASLTGQEPADVKQYHGANSSFPHESTGDQWYSESQFESYRALGFHTMTNILKASIDDEDRERNRRKSMYPDLPIELRGQENEYEGRPSRLDREVLFNRLAELWYAPARIRKEANLHQQMLQKLMIQLAKKPRLRFLDSQFFPEWGMLCAKSDWPLVQNLSPLPERSSQLRAGFYFCNQLIDFMETVYEERNLEAEINHPDNRRWINLFRHWSWSDMFRATWAVAASGYGARFQQFCARELALDLGRVHLGHRIRLTTLREVESHPQLTSEELRQVNLLLQRYIPDDRGTAPGSWKAATTAFVPLILSVARPGDKEFFEFPTGFAIVDGNPPVIGKEHGSGQRLLYFRVRDHLRRLGLGRRGLEELWRSNCEINRDVPPDVQEIIQEADVARLGRLWHSVLAAVPDFEIKQAHEAMRRLEGNVERRDKEIDKKEGGCVETLDNLYTEECQLRDDVIEKCHEVLREQGDNEEALRLMSLAYGWGISPDNRCGKDMRPGEDMAYEILNAIVGDNKYADISFYNLAALCIRSDRWFDEAKGYLSAAVDLNFNSALTAPNDPSFSSVEGEEWFKSICRPA